MSSFLIIKKNTEAHNYIHKSYIFVNMYECACLCADAFVQHPYGDDITLSCNTLSGPCSTTSPLISWPTPQGLTTRISPFRRLEWHTLSCNTPTGPVFLVNNKGYRGRYWCILCNSEWWIHPYRSTFYYYALFSMTNWTFDLDDENIQTLILLAKGWDPN